MSKKWMISLFYLICLVSPVKLSAQGDHFPVIATYYIWEDVNAPPNFLISNTEMYIYMPHSEEAFIRPMENTQAVVLYTSGLQSAAGWSASGRYFSLGMQNPITCKFPEAESYLIIYDVETNTQTAFCIPLETHLLNLAWSPFNENLIFANEEWLIDLTTQTMERTYNGIYPGNQVSDYVGYDHYLWDIETHKPGAVVDLKTSVSTDPNTPVVIESAIFEFCQLSGGARRECNTVVDVTGNYPGEHVFDWQIANNMLLWGAHESGSTEKVSMLGIAPGDRTDTVLYITDLNTGETRELFRLSQLGIENVFTDDLDWSPDANTIALNLRQKTGAFSSEEIGLLSITLDWQHSES
jgi:hypothetical protein